MKQQTRDTLTLIGCAILIVLSLYGVTAFAQDAPIDGAILEWDSSGEQAQEYRVYRGAPQSDGTCSAPVAGYQQIGTVQPPDTTYVDRPLSMNNFYCWFVTAWNVDHGESEASNVVVKRIPFLAVPPAPANLRAR